MSSLGLVPSVYDILLKEFPEYLGLFYKQWYYAHLGEDLPSPTSLFAMHQGKLNFRYFRQYIELGHELRNSPLSDGEAQGDLVKNRSGVRFLSDIANTYVVECDEHEAVVVNGHWMGTGYSTQSFTMMTLNAYQERMVGFEFDDVRPLCRAVHIPTADRGQRGSLRIVG